ncbi:hypothetical protein KEM48_002231 [Puccinia striiformis f. sp. tritici PST-130]|nr:hypothetical protein KEM48_002231 [Puccinia striiformis f. sp. tritici PST-130]
MAEEDAYIYPFAILGEGHELEFKLIWGARHEKFESVKQAQPLCGLILLSKIMGLAGWVCSVPASA